MAPAPPASTAELLQHHADAWAQATRHPFLEGVRDGSLPRLSFHRWLVQDRHFALGLFAAQARVMALAPPSEWPILLGGLNALLAELEWFERHVRSRSLDFEQPLHPTCRAYVDFLLALGFAPYPVGITALWACERVYLEAWSSARPCAAEYQEFVDRWTAPPFLDYVRGLETAAGAALAQASNTVRAAAGDGFRQITSYECAFWAMTTEATG